MDYKNIEPFLGAIVSSGKATLKELKESYTIEDAFNLFEIIAIDAYNENQAIKHAQKKRAK